MAVWNADPAARGLPGGLSDAAGAVETATPIVPPPRPPPFRKEWECLGANATDAHSLTIGPVGPRGAVPHGGVPEWLKGTDCKSVGYAYVGSNPTPSTSLRCAAVKTARHSPQGDDGLRFGTRSFAWQASRKCAEEKEVE